MRTKITITTLFVLLLTSISLLAQAPAKPKVKNEKKPIQKTEAALSKSADETAQEFLKKIKAQEIPSEKKKILVSLLDTFNKETAKQSDILTKNISKVLQSESEGKVDADLVKQKDDSQLVVDSWVYYKNALQPNYDLFIEKKEDSYTCNNIAEQINAKYAPISAQPGKTELDPVTKKAIETSIEIAEELCKYAQDIQ